MKATIRAAMATSSVTFLASFTGAKGSRSREERDHAPPRGFHWRESFSL